jgi:hypothetical protein
MYIRKDFFHRDVKSAKFLDEVGEVGESDIM